MGRSLAQRAAHWLRRRAPLLAESAVDALYRMRPELETRYGPGGRRHCAKDIGHHLDFLAAAVEMDEPKVFADYVEWAAGVMVAHKVAPEDTAASFHCLEDLSAMAPEDLRSAIIHIVTAGLRRLDACGPLAPPPSTAGSAPSRS